MNKISTFTILFFLSCLSTAVKSDGDHDHDHNAIEFIALNKKLPIGLSDMAATYVDDWKGEGVEAIILTGGCSDENGNSEFIENNSTSYYCGQVTANAYVFFPSTEDIIEVSAMPTERYRHSAAFVNGKLYVVGGRTLIDDVIETVDVYDPTEGDKGTWSTHMTLDAADAASDQASFTRQGSIYLLGGYSGADYTTRNDVISLNVETNEIVSLPSMNEKRGDASAVYYDQDGVKAVYIMGGFTVENNFCEPLAHGEMYDFETNKWIVIDELNSKRGDKNVVTLNGRIIVIGGEDKHESICDDKLAGVEPSSHAVPVDDVESIDPRDGKDAEWHSEADFPVTRFRSAAAVSTELNKVYVFGGQMPYDIDCKCYKPSKDIFSYRDNGAFGRTIGFALGVVVSSVVALLW